ncbi:MAG: 50S ribosomal protein L35 [Phycisphaeraceae bacterium]|jgi:large subunit ribosomal protein L35|nr:50S ribosomal protein L35 [Phycisphaeraceae bacterium]
MQKKNKPHKGLLKRVRVTKSGLVKHKSANSKHLKSGKSPNRLRKLRRDRLASNADAKALERQLHRRLRGRDQSLATIRKSPSPAQSKALKAAKAAKAAAAGK